MKAPKFSGRHRTEDRGPSPPCPHKWESHEEIEKLENSLKRKSNFGQDLRSVKTSNLQDKLESSSSKVRSDYREKTQRELPTTFKGNGKFEVEEKKEEFYSTSTKSSWSGKQKIVTTKTVELTTPQKCSENKFNETHHNSAKQHEIKSQQYFEEQHQHQNQTKEESRNVEPQNYYQSSTTLEQVSNVSSKTESSFGTQSFEVQGSSPVRLPVLSVAAVKTDALLSSSPSLTSNLSDSSQSTVVRKSDSSAIQMSKSENK